MSDALSAAQRAVRSSSANYLVAHRDGIAVDIEAAAGTSRACSCCSPTGRAGAPRPPSPPAFDRKDVSLWVMPDSPFRLERLHGKAIRERRRDSRWTPSEPCWPTTANYPSGVCCHPRRSDGAPRPRVDRGLGAHGPRRSSDVGRGRTPVHRCVPRARRGDASTSRAPSAEGCRRDGRPRVRPHHVPALPRRPADGPRPLP